MDRLLQMILNRLMGRLINHGIKAGINHVAGKGKPAAQMTEEERAQSAEAKLAAKRARQAANIARKMMR